MTLAPSEPADPVRLWWRVARWMAGDIDMGHARALLAVDAASQITMAHQVVNKRMSVRDTEKLVTAALKYAQADASLRPVKAGGRDLERLEEELSDALAANVKIKLGRKGRGTLTIDFGNRDALEGIIDRLRTDRAESA